MKFREMHSLWVVLAASAFLMSCGEQKKEATAVSEESQSVEPVASSHAKTTGIAFDREDLDVFFTQYLALQASFVASEAGRVQEIAREMEGIALQGSPEVSKSIAALAESDHLGQQRAIFFQLNKAMVPLLESHLSSGEIYQQVCPMAFENTGAFWFSNSEEILNPYFGDAMLHCGKVGKTFGAL
ncbi:MAG: hypothetical protein R3252_05065 [Robiginitalea sp.]|nr:hypothetical protein [Robiginitalea sp.]